MSIILDRQMRELISHGNTMFPITYFQNELSKLPNLSGPLHWHPDFEIATAENNFLNYQVGQHHIILQPGDSIFINGNMLHGIKQLSGNIPDLLPTIVFSGVSIASGDSAIYQKYIQPIEYCDSLPFIVFRHENPCYDMVNNLINNTYILLREQKDCYEMAVQRNLSSIFEYIYLHISEIPKFESTRIQINNQIRIQKMLTYIYEHYSESVTLDDISGAANISRSEAGRCFNTYIGCSPIDALIQYRLQIAYQLLSDKSMTLEEISYNCGFNSVNYFRRQFKKNYGYTPGKRRIG